MLLMKPNCECCDRDLAADAEGAMICSFECTFCAACAEGRFKGVCPNCDGGLAPRPTRTGDRLKRFPAATQRVLKPPDEKDGACAA